MEDDFVFSDYFSRDAVGRYTNLKVLFLQLSLNTNEEPQKSSKDTGSEGWIMVFGDEDNTFAEQQISNWMVDSGIVSYCFILAGLGFCYISRY